MDRPWLGEVLPATHCNLNFTLNFTLNEKVLDHLTSKLRNLLTDFKNSE
jgi:hypothetical protein